MTTYYADSPYGLTLSVSGNKQAITSEWLQQFSAFMQGGSIPYWIRYQYQVAFIITGGTVANPTFGGWGPLDETVDKINATPGLRILLPIQQFPSMFWRITGSGQDVGYGGGTPTDPAVLPRWDDYARIAAIIAKRYGNSIQCYQIGNEEYDIQAHSGGVLAPVFNAAYPAIKQWSSSPVVMGAVRKLPPGGTHVSAWMNAFVNYVPKTGEPPQVVPDGSDFHYYRDGSSILSTRFPPPPPYAADPATTDNSLHPGQAAVPSVADEYTIIRPILDTLASGIPIWNMEFGWDNSNAANAHGSYNGTSIPTNVSRYTLTQMAQSHLAGISKSMQFTIGQYTDPKTLHKQGLTDYMNYIAANPQWVGTTPPSAYLYQSVDRLDFEGTVGTAPDPQWYAITNPTGSSQSWSVSSNQAWLTTSTIGTNGIGSTTGAGNTSGTLTTGQRITLVVNADSTHSGLTTLTTLTGTLTVTIGGNVSHITINLWVNPNDAVPSISIDQAQLSPTGAVNGSNPAATTVNITNAGNYTHNWYSYILGSWLSVDVASGTLASGASQAVSISASTAGLAPGLYTETVYFALTPFPAQYKNQAPPPNPEYVSCTVTLKVTANVAPTVQLSTPVMAFTAGASGIAPPDQTFFIQNCTKSTQNWTVAAGSYSVGASGWLTLTPASGTGLPASGSTTAGTPPNVQSTDYTLVTASINNTALAAGTYTCVVTCTLGGSATATITVTYVVTTTSPTEIIGASPNAIPVAGILGGAPVTTTTTLTNTGNTGGNWTKTKTYTSGTGGWLTMTPGSGTLAASGGTQTVTFTCTPGTLAVGTYTAAVVFTLGTSTATVNITFVITSSVVPAAITCTPTGLTFTDQLGGATNPPPQSLTIGNSGTVNGNWSAAVGFSSGGTDWLTLSQVSGALAGGTTQSLSVVVDDTTLAAGNYTATITFTMAGTTTSCTISFLVTPGPPPPVIGSRSNMLSLAVQKTQVVKIYDQFGNFITVWRDAPLLTGLKSTMNAADGQVKMTLPRRIDAFGGAGQPGTDNSVVLGNNVQIWLYGPGLPSAGLLKLNGVIDIVEPTIDANNAESVTVTITPYGSIVADHGFPGNITLSNVDPISFFTYWFLNNDPTPGLGNVPYANPLTLSPVSATSSGLGPTTYTIQNQPIKSVFDTVMLMLGAGWFWRIDPDKSALITQLAPVAQHILYLGQHMASMSYSIDNSNRKNVICFVGATGVKAIAVSPISAMPPSQGGIGERIAYYQDSRITDNGSAQIMANGLLSLLDQPLVRIKCRLIDYRGDTRTSLGYDIESINVGDTVSIRDARQMGSPTTWGTFKWGSGVWGKSPGLAFNQIVPVLNIDYNWNYIDIECGTFAPSQDRNLFRIRSILQDFTVGQP